MKFAFCSYAFGEKYIQARAELEGQIRAQGIDNIFTYTEIDEDFKQRHADIFAVSRTQSNGMGGPQIVVSGDGCCMWKPYLLLKTMEHLEMGDILLYMDCTDKVVGAPTLKQYLVDRCDSRNGIASMSMPLPNKDWTRRDTFVITNSDSEEYWNMWQHEAGFIAFRKSMLTMEFISTWLGYNSNIVALGGLPENKFGENLPGFKEHRYDQSIYSILLKKFGANREVTGANMRPYGLDHWMNYCG